MSLLASLVFAVAIVAALAALRLTMIKYSGAAMANLAALRTTDTAREFCYQAVTVVARPAVCGEVRRIAVRITAPRRFKSSAGLRAAA